MRTTVIKAVSVVGLVGATALALFLTQVLPAGRGHLGRANAAESANLSLTAALTGQSAASSASGRSSTSSPIPGANYGHSVVVLGTTAVIGTPEAFGGQGAVYIYNRSGTAWHLTKTLNDPHGFHDGDFFGYSVAIFGSTIAVGAPEQDNRRGEVYLYQKSGGAWGLAKELPCPFIGGTEQNFGASVALAGAQLVVGAPGTNNNTGVIYIYTRYASGWYPTTAKLLPNALEGDNFGFSVAIANGTIFAGAPGRGLGAGMVAAFGYAPGTQTSWKITRLIHDPGKIQTNDGFGFSVSLTAATAMIGAPGQSTSRGAAYIYSHTGSGWQLLTKLVDPGKAPVAGDNFGNAVSISGGTAMIGSSFTNGSSGVVYEATDHSGNWQLTRGFADPRRVAGDSFGSSVSVSGGIAVIGAVGTNNGAGAAYIYSQAVSKKQAASKK